MLRRPRLRKRLRAEPRRCSTSDASRPVRVYRVTTLAKTIDWEGKLTDWLYGLTKDCPRKQSPGLSEPCGARCTDLPKVF
jgi:hypothetical protein